MNMTSIGQQISNSTHPHPPITSDLQLTGHHPFGAGWLRPVTCCNMINNNKKKGTNNVAQAIRVLGDTIIKTGDFKQMVTSSTTQSPQHSCTVSHSHLNSKLCVVVLGRYHPTQNYFCSVCTLLFTIVNTVIE